MSTNHSPTMKLQADDCPDANGFITIRQFDGTPTGNTELPPVATVYSDVDAFEMVHKLNTHAQLVEALEGLLKAIPADFNDGHNREVGSRYYVGWKATRLAEAALTAAKSTK